MKTRKRVATSPKVVRKKSAGKKKIRKKISRLQASTEEGKAERLAEWREYWKARKKPVTMYMDADVLAWFRKEGPGYQTRINAALRQLMMKKVGK
jgi:uncharacterized protein (DUF4415 family)